MNTTGFLNKIYFSRRQKQLERYATHAKDLQLKIFRHLIRQGSKTEWGKQHHYEQIDSYEQFRQQVHVNTYEELKSYIHKMREGNADILWPGVVRWYAKSSGTTNDKSKFIPVSGEGLKNIHYRGGTDCIVSYLHINPKSNFFSGKSLILGGSHSPNLNTPNSLVGDLSAILIENIPSAAKMIRVPKKNIALLSDFEEKRDKIARAAMDMNITNISVLTTR